MKIPGYTIIRELGSGGMATVYLARQDRLTRSVALKVMKPIAMAGDDFTSRFIKEGQIIAQLQHPQIVTIYDFDSTDGYHYFSMEYLQGGSLADEIKKGIPVARTLRIVKQIAEALAVAHAKGVIHRDVKPQNILFRADGTPVLTDFGIARTEQRNAESMQLTRFGMIIGSPRYMSPEQSTGRPLDPRTDLYSLGVVFYEMLTQQLPYRAEDVVSLAMQHCTEPIPRLPESLAPYQPILDRMIAKQPEDRYASAGQLIRALEDFANGTLATSLDDDATQLVARGASVRPPADSGTQTASASTDTTQPVDSGTQGRPLSERQGVRLMTLLLVVVLVAGIGLYLARRPPPEPPGSIGTEQLPPAPPNRAQTAIQYEKLAIEHVQKAQYEQSLEIVRLGLASAPDDARLAALQGLIQNRQEVERQLAQAHELLRENRLDESLARVASGLQRIPAHPGLLDLRAELQRRLEERTRQQADALRARAQASLDAGRHEDAMTLAREGLALLPGHRGLTEVQTGARLASERQAAVQAALRQAGDFLAAGTPERASEVIERALEAAPNDSQLLDLRASVRQQSQRQLEQRIAELFEQAQALRAQGEFARGLAAIDEGLRLDPDHRRLKTLRDEILAAQEREREQQVADFLKQANTQFEQRDDVASLALIEQGLALSPDNAELLALRDRIDARRRTEGQLAEILRDCDLKFPLADLPVENAHAAFDCYAEAFKLDAAHAPARERIGKIADRLANRAESSLKRRQLDEAGNALKQLQAIAPDHSRLENLNKSFQSLRNEMLTAQEREREQQVAAFLKQANTQFEQRDDAASLALIEQGLALSPDNAALLALRDRIAARRQTEEQLADILRDCDLKFPLADLPVENAHAAFDCYAEALKLDANHAPTQERILKLGDLLANKVETLLKRYQIDEAEHALEQLHAMVPDHPRLANLTKDVRKDRTWIPKTRVIDGGCFQMGSPATETGREDDERPHQVCVNTFELGQFEVSVKEFKRFAEATGYRTDAQRDVGGLDGCWTLDQDDKADAWGYRSWANWQKPNRYQATRDQDPVSCVSWNDAQAYLGWLNRETGGDFRLPTEAEWEYAARAGSTTTRYWGDALDDHACRYANSADAGHGWADGFPCDDKQEWVAPIGSFEPNPWGLKDMLGNLWEWTCSEYDADYTGSEQVCAASDSNDPRALRGGAWESGPSTVRSAYRNRNFPESRYSFVGFRIARDSSPKARLPAGNSGLLLGKQSGGIQ
ncbi:SUMF1/EgtB/PvdO family nonheme iron enzyme [Thiocystis violascens]|uniref:Protein kinase domain-containing protein n=1 Tax=Thiocystis violascens (strain ATCC 17096 / DSM 198 / 6111) TaxID=765911 RepID=I3YH69_THIV6|nr:SUMF1/EgtB/PvdO family nonheme iron enzyme [Thiocystis violascens]AFL76337.1 hypothetical protein Thivi_4543 [Thiocystis violascens DSM 198]